MTGRQAGERASPNRMCMRRHEAICNEPGFGQNVHGEFHRVGLVSMLDPHCIASILRGVLHDGGNPRAEPLRQATG